jgi:hypothetical protein
MLSLSIAQILGQGAAKEARSALPGAPVVAHVDRARMARAPERRSRVGCATWPTSLRHRDQ